MPELFEIEPVTVLDSIPVSANCQEASTLSREKYIPCFAPAVAIVYSPRDRRPYWMCGNCANHNLSNRGALLVYSATQSFGLMMMMEHKRQSAARDAGLEWKDSRGNLPNQTGFRFVARLMDGTEQTLEVVRGPNGFTVSGAPYELIFIWRPLRADEAKKTAPVKSSLPEGTTPRFVTLKGGSIRDELKHTIAYQPLPGQLPKLFVEVMNEAWAKGEDVPEYEEIMQTLAARGKVQL
jgi:hypothetical protein